MRLGSRRTRRIGAAVGVVLLGVLAVPPALGGSGVGAVFNLGRGNSVNAVTTLSGTTTSRMLQITNYGTGAALQLNTKTTAPPLKVNSSVRVVNLNADKVDGVDASAFVQPTGETQVAVGNADWAEQSPGAGLLKSILTNGVGWKRPSTGAQFIVATPTLPVAAFGKATELRGFEVCFTASTGNTLTAVELDVASSTDAGTTASAVVNDTTTRSGHDCALFVLGTPVALDATKTVSLFLNVNWGTANTTFTVQRTTFVLGVTGAAATPVIP